MSEDTTQISGASALSGELARDGGSGAPAHERRARLKELYTGARACTRCPQLVAGRTQVVFGAGNADAELMFIGEAPGAREDEEGVPFIGASGKLLGELLGSIGLVRDDVFVTTILKCRPPGNRDPAPAEISRCRPYLEEQIALIEPRVVCTLGNFATKLLRGDNTGIATLHGQAEVITVGRRTVHLLPLYHPAAALYTRALLDTLRDDVLRLPELLARPAPPQPEAEAEPEPVEQVAAAAEVQEPVAPVEGTRGRRASADEPEPPPSDQLGLF